MRGGGRESTPEEATAKMLTSPITRPKPREVVAKRMALDELAGQEAEAIRQGRQQYLENLKRVERIARERAMNGNNNNNNNNYNNNNSDDASTSSNHSPPNIRLSIGEGQVFGSIRNADAVFGSSAAALTQQQPPQHIPSPEERILARKRSGLGLQF
jgi:hypothetical protein